MVHLQKCNQHKLSTTSVGNIRHQHVSPTSIKPLDFIMYLRLSTFYHFIANIDIGEELETIKRKKKFNAETLEATTTENDDPKQNVIYDPNGNVVNLADFQVHIF